MKKKVEDLETVCCMCGDVGFPDHLFRCSNCRNRSQHSYCSNSYRGGNAEASEVCDWCLFDENYSSTSVHEGGATTGKANGGTASRRITTRRYKLLKDVMC